MFKGVNLEVDVNNDKVKRRAPLPLRAITIVVVFIVDDVNLENVVKVLDIEDNDHEFLESFKMKKENKNKFNDAI